MESLDAINKVFNGCVMCTADSKFTNKHGTSTCDTCLIDTSSLLVSTHLPFPLALNFERVYRYSGLPVMDADVARRMYSFSFKERNRLQTFVHNGRRVVPLRPFRRPKKSVYTTTCERDACGTKMGGGGFCSVACLLMDVHGVVHHPVVDTADVLGLPVSTIDMSMELVGTALEPEMVPTPTYLAPIRTSHRRKAVPIQSHM